jgi:hypothetical protein
MAIMSTTASFYAGYAGARAEERFREFQDRPLNLSVGRTGRFANSTLLKGDLSLFMVARPS